MSIWDLEPGVHGHVCVNPNCQWAWTHGNDSANNRKDHTCPACGTVLAGGWLKEYPDKVRERLAQQPPIPPSDIPPLTPEQEREIYAHDNDAFADTILGLFSQALSRPEPGPLDYDEYDEEDYE